MALDTSKLQNVVKAANGDIQARCPACAAAGNDTQGNHLKIFADGKYACAAFQGDKGHRKEIHKLAGVPMNAVARTGQVTVKPLKVPEASVVMDLAKFSRFARKPRESR